MPVTIKSRSGQVKKVLGISAAEEFCSQLASLDDSDLGLRTDVWVAYHLGLGDENARKSLEDRNIVTAAWPRVSHWFTRPDVGDQLLPEGSRWSISRDEKGSGVAELVPGGWAGQPFHAIARTPWAAFAICLIRAYAAGGFNPKERSGGR